MSSTLQKIKSFWLSKTPTQRVAMVFFVVALLSSLLALGLFSTKKEELSGVWKLIPDDAVMVIESPKLIDTFEKLKNASIWRSLRQMAYFDSAHHKAAALKRLRTDSLSIPEFLRGRNVYAAVLITARTDFDYLFFTPLQPTEQVFMQNIFAKVCNDYQLKIRSRNYNEIPIYEIYDSQTFDLEFVYCIHQDYLICSYTPLLVEDAIRKMIDDEPSSFLDINKELFKLAQVSEDDANLYINFKKFSDFLAIFTEDSARPILEALSALTGSFSLDAMVADNNLLLNGYSFFTNPEEAGKNDFLKLFLKQEPTSIAEILRIVPKQTAVFYRLGLSDPEGFFEKRNKEWKQNEPAKYAKLENLASEHSFSPDKFFKCIQSEVAVAYLEPEQGQAIADKLTFVRLKSRSKAEKMLNILAENTASVSGNTAKISQKYGRYTFTRVSIPDFSAILFGEMFGTSPQTFYTFLNDEYLVMGTRELPLRQLIEAIKQEEVWDKLISHRQFLDQIGKKSNLNFIVHVPRAWHLFSPYLNSTWQAPFEQYKFELLKFEFLGCQFLSDPNRMETNITIRHEKSSRAEAVNPNDTTQTVQATNFNLETKTKFQSQLISQPYIVRNHTDRKPEVIVQDAAFNVHLVGNDGKILWTRNLGDAICGKVMQIDYYNNGKLQFLIATSRHIYLMDRLGRVVGEFPVVLPAGQKIEYISVLDYDNSKNYRIAAATREGNVYLFDKEGRPLDGWQPKSLSGGLIAPLTHLRVAGRDCMLAIQKNGIVSVLKRDAVQYPKFPLAFNESDLGGTFFATINSSFGNSRLTVLNSKGDLIDFNLDGKITNLSTLESKSSKSIFTLCSDAVANKSWIVSRQEDKDLTFLRPDGKELFTKNFNTASEKDVCYYNLGGSLEIITVFDKIEKNTYIYYISGELVNHKPVSSAQKIALLYSESQKKFLVYKSHQNECQVLSFDY
ncbi:MAG: hypothetical protein EAZ57_00710 [Cytophagales bacterium]|nr:MAG: hypothetical protein EAZ67_00420 [Cytophagales bacterium]TAF62308.1 MAG: hypothetical protein EAZ57_00710 [Cytophagales bacterium]